MANFDLESKSTFWINDLGETYCNVCGYKFNFNVARWKVLWSGFPKNICHGPIEALRLFLEFYTLHFNVVGVNKAHQIIHVFCTNRRKVFGYYKGPSPPKF